MTTLFSYDHNWRSSLKIDHEFKTSILTSRAYREQRIAERIAPRKTLALDVMLANGGYTETLESLVHLLQEEWVMPEFTRRKALIDTGDTDPSILAMDAVPGWIEEGATVVLDNGTDREMAVVDSAGGGVVALTAPTEGVWYAGGGYVYPGLIGRFKQSANVRNNTNRAATVSLEFMADPGDDHEEDTSAPLTFNGRELWMTRPNWLQPIGQNLIGRLETMDFDRGVLDHYAPVNWLARNFQATYLGRDNTEAEALLAFWHRLRGQQGEFYMPTWQDDLSLVYGAAMGAGTLVVPGTRVSDLFAGSTVYKAVMAMFRDGTYEAKLVSSITDNGTNTTLNLATNWTKAVNAATAFRVCWLPVWRSATDTLTIEWLTRSVAQCQFSFVATEDL